MASHSNCRAIVPTDRQLSDEMIRAIVAARRRDRHQLLRQVPPAARRVRQAPREPADVVRHAEHICDLAGNARHVAIGTDMDGGLGRDEIPEEITTSADLPKVADALRAAGFGDADVAASWGGTGWRSSSETCRDGRDHIGRPSGVRPRRFYPHFSHARSSSNAGRTAATSVSPSSMAPC